MNIALLFVPILLWSCVGLLVKVAALSFAPPLLSFFRFFFGLVFLGLWVAGNRRKVSVSFRSPWIWFAAAAKSLSYITENQALTHGASWGYIVEQPVQAVAFLLISAFFFKERPSLQRVGAAVLCIVGALLIGVKGIAAARTGGALDFALFIVAGFGASAHMTGQKVLMRSMDSEGMNLSVFLVATAITALSLPLSGNLLVGPLSTPAIIASVALGFITGASFLIWGVALSRVSFLVSGITSNSLVLFALLWGLLLRGERPGVWSLWGTGIFVVGLVAMNVPLRRRRKSLEA